jgi:hypothetical protein
MAAARLLNQDSVMPINQMAKVLRRPVYLCPPHGTLNHRFGAYVGELVFENQLTGLTEELELRQFNTEVSYFDH